MQTVIDLLQHKHLIWQGSQQINTVGTSSSGYSVLDEQLGGGFPSHGVVEISSDVGIGELRLLTPYIRDSGKTRLSLFINPPAYLCSEYLAQQDIDPQRVVVIFPTTEKEALWAAEQCLKSGCCGSVTLWHPSLEVHQARRLQVASETGHCLNFIFKTGQTQQVSLPISLSMLLRPQKKGLEVRVHKRKGGWLNTTFTLDMTQQWAYLTEEESRETSTHNKAHMGSNLARFPKHGRGGA